MTITYYITVVWYWMPFEFYCPANMSRSLTVQSAIIRTHFKLFNNGKDRK